MTRVGIVALCALGMSACASQSAEERLCRTFLTSSAINPETVDVKEFQPLTEAQITANPVMDLLRDGMVTGPHGGLVPGEGAKFYSARVRAEGRLGNTITSQQFCAVPSSNDSCVCIEMPS